MITIAGGFYLVAFCYWNISDVITSSGWYHWPMITLSGLYCIVYSFCIINWWNEFTLRILYKYVLYLGTWVRSTKWPCCNIVTWTDTIELQQWTETDKETHTDRNTNLSYDICQRLWPFELRYFKNSILTFLKQASFTFFKEI